MIDKCFNPLLLFFIIPILYLIFTFTTYGREDAISKNIKIIRRIYYSIWLFIAAVIINIIDVKKLEINNSFGIPKVIWMVFLVFIASMVTAVILDILIISASGLKEVSLGWAKISKDEVQANIEEQKNNMDKILDKIESEYEVIQNFEEYIQRQCIRKKLEQDFEHFNWPEEFKELTQYYCNFQSSNIKVAYLIMDDLFNRELKLTYNLTDTNINTVIKDINENKSTIVAQRYQLVFIPYTPVYYNKKIVIILKGREYIFEVEQRFIVNLFKIFENYVTDIIATLEY